MVQAFGVHGGSVVSEEKMSLRLSKRIFISNLLLFVYYHSYFYLKGMLHDTRVLACLTPGCRAAQDPGVVMSDTRVSYNLP